MFEWRFDRTFKLSIDRSEAVARVVLAGELDAVTAKNLERRARLPELSEADVVIDLSQLEEIDTAGARQIRRLQSLYADCEVWGAPPAVLELLELMPQPARPTSADLA